MRREGSVRETPAAKAGSGPCAVGRSNPRKLEVLVKILTIEAASLEPQAARQEKTGESNLPGTLFDGTDGID